MRQKVTACPLPVPLNSAAAIAGKTPLPASRTCGCRTGTLEIADWLFAWMDRHLDPKKR